MKKTMQTFSMNNLFNQCSRGVVKYVGRGFSAFEDLPQLEQKEKYNFGELITVALGGIPKMCGIAEGAAQEERL